MVCSTWYIDIRILQTMVSGIPILLGLGTKKRDPYVDVVRWAPFCGCMYAGMYICPVTQQ